MKKIGMSFLSDKSRQQLIEEPIDIFAGMVYGVGKALFDYHIAPQFPLISWEDCPRRISSPLFMQASAIVGSIIEAYEARMILNGFEVPGLMGMVGEDVENITKNGFEGFDLPDET